MFYIQYFKKKKFYYLVRTRELSIQDIHGKPFKARPIFVESIRFLRDHFLKLLEMRHYIIPEDDICYTLTVPAIWSDATRQFMKEAAIHVYVDQNNIQNYRVSCLKCKLFGSWLIKKKN